jgi:hypothetical protein
MFTLTVTDHVCLDSEQVARNYTVHARAAERLAALALSIRMAIVALLVVAACASIAELLFDTRIDRIAAVSASSIALVAFVFYAVAGLEGRVAAHRAFAQRLWLISERYRSLTTEMEEGTVDRGTLLRRRDELINQLHTVYEHGFAGDQVGYEGDRLPRLSPTQAAGVPSSSILSPG